jgi:hypothetical protein
MLNLELNIIMLLYNKHVGNFTLTLIKKMVHIIAIQLDM